MIDVVCAVIEGENLEVLACKRPAGKHLAGQWEFPGGKVEDGEAREAALIREIREELGVGIRITSALQPVTWAYPARTIRLWPFRCTIIDGCLTAHEHEELRWCAPDAMPHLDWAAADKLIVDEVMKARPESYRYPRS